MSNGIPSQISLDNAVVAQDEMGRPFIIVREYSLSFTFANSFFSQGRKKRY